MIKMLYKFIVLLFTLSSGLFAQSVLTIEEAIKTGLEKNFSVLIVKNEQEISKLQNNFGSAGMSPTVSVNGNLNLATVNSYQEFSTGTIQERNAAQSNNTAASLNVGWLVFDGLKMFAIKKRLNQNEKLSALQLKQQMESTVYDIIASYYLVVKTTELIKAAKQNLSIYEERKKIAKLKLEIGADSKVDYLLSQSDENKGKSAIIQLELQLLNTKTKLNTLLSKPVDADFITTDSIVINYNPNIDELKKSVSKSNASILISKQNELIFEQTIKEARAANLPFLQLNAAYNITRNQNQAGFVFLNKQAGLNAGVSAGWLLFNGTKNNKLVKEKNILFLNQKYLTEQIQQQVDGQVYNSYKTYLLNKEILELEKQNLSDSKEVLSISMERYKVGKANLLETIETQKNLEDAQVRYIEALFAIKMSETDLLKANGSLIK
ncbi:MAG: TolC family protein [Bacteroidia bacterium]|nr:TolC family protein [Bacteroidia bacterium]